MNTNTLPSMDRFVSLLTTPTLDDLHNCVSSMDSVITVYQGAQSSILGALTARQIADLEMGR